MHVLSAQPVCCAEREVEVVVEYEVTFEAYMGDKCILYN